MVFGKRRWAAGVVREAGLDPESGSGRAVVALLTVASKKAQRLARTSGPRGEMDDLDFVMMAARAAPSESAAVGRIEKALGLGAGEAVPLLSKVAAAAVRFYQDEGRELGAPRPPRMREPWSPPPRWGH